MHLGRTHILWLIVLTSLARAQEPSRQPTPYLHGLTFGPYEGWTNCLAVNDSHGQYQAVIVPDIGGRLVHYSYDLINILYLNPQVRGRTLANSRGPFYAGGYQCDLGPETLGLPRRFQTVLGKHAWRSPRDYTVDTASPQETGVPVRILKSVTMDHDTGELGLLQRMSNVSKSVAEYSIRDRTVCKGGGFVFFKLNPKSRFKKGCSLLRQSSGRYFYQELDELPENMEKSRDTMIIDTSRIPAKIGADSVAGWIAYVRGNLLFVKYFPITRDGDYADGGNTLSVMWNGTVTELSPTSPRVKIKPGENYDFPERWILKPVSRTVDSISDVKRILREVPSNPFAKSGAVSVPTRRGQ
ncbi:MAG: hypothetical protein ACPGVU_10585 [Limisphaerales bacterium]